MNSRCIGIYIFGSVFFNFAPFFITDHFSLSLHFNHSM